MSKKISKWIKITGALLSAGGLAWSIKLAVIISTDGRIIDTGAAALLMKIGLICFFVGSTGIGTRFTANFNVALRTIAILLSPVLVFGTFILFSKITFPLFQGSSIWYAQQEAGIGLAALFYLVAGFLLYRSARVTN